MAGYADDFSMSNNAIDAYDRGLRPRSKWGKADILNALPADARTYLQLDKYPLEFLREYFLEVEEWHHTSKHYNRTDFCRPSIAHWSTSTTEDVQNLYVVSKRLSCAPLTSLASPFRGASLTTPSSPAASTKMAVSTSEVSKYTATTAKSMTPDTTANSQDQ